MGFKGVKIILACFRDDLPLHSFRFLSSFRTDIIIRGGNSYRIFFGASYFLLEQTLIQKGLGMPRTICLVRVFLMYKRYSSGNFGTVLFTKHTRYHLGCVMYNVPPGGWAENKDPDQAVHPPCLIRSFGACQLDLQYPKSSSRKHAYIVLTLLNPTFI